MALILLGPKQFRSRHELNVYLVMAFILKGIHSYGQTQLQGSETRRYTTWEIETKKNFLLKKSLN